MPKSLYLPIVSGVFDGSSVNGSVTFRSIPPDVDGATEVFGVVVSGSSVMVLVDGAMESSLVCSDIELNDVVKCESGVEGIGILSKTEYLTS